MLQDQVGKPCDQDHADGKNAVGDGPGDVPGHHRELGHSADAGQHVKRHENDAENGQSVNHPVLVDIDETGDQ